MQTGEVIIYRSADGQTAIDVKLENDTVWLTQNQIVDLFESSKANISEHITYIVVSGELNGEASVRKFRTVRKEGKGRLIENWNIIILI